MHRVSEPRPLDREVFLAANTERTEESDGDEISSALSSPLTRRGHTSPKLAYQNTAKGTSRSKISTGSEVTKICQE